MHSLLPFYLRVLEGDARAQQTALQQLLQWVELPPPLLNTSQVRGCRETNSSNHGTSQTSVVSKASVSLTGVGNHSQSCLSCCPGNLLLDSDMPSEKYSIEHIIKARATTKVQRMRFRPCCSSNLAICSSQQGCRRTVWCCSMDRQL